MKAGQDDPSSWLRDAERDNPPHAMVTKVGRWRYAIHISHGIGRYGPDGGSWHRFGERRARRKADRELRRYLANHQPKPRFEIWP